MDERDILGEPTSELGAPPPRRPAPPVSDESGEPTSELSWPTAGPERQPPRIHYAPQYPPQYPQGQYPMYPAPPLQPVPDLRDARKQFSTLGLGVFMILVIATVLQAAGAILAGIIYLDSDMPSWLIWVLSAVPMYAVAMPVGILILRTVPAQPPEEQKIGFERLLILLLICIACMYGGNLVSLLVTSLLEVVLGVSSLNPLETTLLGNSVLSVILVTVIIAPIFEELIFRKLLIDRMRCYGERVAVFVAALMFGLMHGNLSQLFYAFAVGLVLGYVYLRSGRLRYTIGLHMGLNFLGGALPTILTDGLDLDAMGTVTDPRIMMGLFTPRLLLYFGFAMAMICLAIGGAVLLVTRIGKVRFYRAPMELPKGARFRTIFLNVGMILLILTCVGSIVLMCLIA